MLPPKLQKQQKLRANSTLLATNSTLLATNSTLLAGQLLIYSIPIKNNVDLILVLPEKLKDTVVKRLAELRIKILYYDFNDKVPVFKKIHEIL